jgi:hypothetical protein
LLHRESFYPAPGFLFLPPDHLSLLQMILIVAAAARQIPEDEISEDDDDDFVPDDEGADAGDSCRTSSS